MQNGRLHRNEIAGDLIHLCQKAFANSAVWDKPFILSTAAEKEKDSDTNDEGSTNYRGDLIIGGFWHTSSYCVVDVHITNTDAKSYCDKVLEKILAMQERAKKKQYLEPCLN